MIGLISFTGRELQPDFDLWKHGLKLSEPNLAGLVAIGLVVSLLAAGVIRFVVRRFFQTGAPLLRTNSAVEGLVAVAALQILGPPLAVLLGELAEVLLSKEAGGSAAFQVNVTVGFDAAAVLFLWRCAVRRPVSFPAWGLRRSQLFNVLCVMPIVLAAYVPLHLVVLLLWAKAVASLGIPLSPQPLLVESLRQGGLSLGIVAGCAVTVIPFLEEILFRGALYQGLRPEIGPVGAALLSGFLFAACHHHLPSFGPLFALACLLAFVYERTGSLWAPVVLHSLFNASQLGIA